MKKPNLKTQCLANRFSWRYLKHFVYLGERTKPVQVLTVIAILNVMISVGFCVYEMQKSEKTLEALLMPTIFYAGIATWFYFIGRKDSFPQTITNCIGYIRYRPVKTFIPRIIHALRLFGKKGHKVAIFNSCCITHQEFFLWSWNWLLLSTLLTPIALLVAPLIGIALFTKSMLLLPFVGGMSILILIFATVPILPFSALTPNKKYKTPPKPPTITPPKLFVETLEF